MADERQVYWTSDVFGAIKQFEGVAIITSTQATSDRAPDQITIDKSFVYWTETTGAIYQAKRTDDNFHPAEPELIAVDPGMPTNIAVDDYCVYWTSAGPDESGRIMRAPK